MALAITVSLTLTACSDITAPVVSAVTVTPALIDTSAGTASVTVEATVTDDLAGTNSARVTFHAPAGGQTVEASFHSGNRVSGTQWSGTYRQVLTVPQFATQGRWFVSGVSADDLSNNRFDLSFATPNQAAGVGHPATFVVAGAADNTAPLVSAVSVTPAQIDTSTGATTVVVEGTVSDDLAGTNSARVTFRSPTGGQTTEVSFHSDNRISGDRWFGTYRAVANVPQYAAQGHWFVGHIYADDLSNNRSNLSFATSTQAASAGFTATFEQTGAADSTAPVVSAVSVTPTQIDTSTGATTVVIEATVSDDLSGTNSTRVTFRAPTGGQTTEVSFHSDNDGAQVNLPRVAH